jgi:hypothetical protein
MDLDSIEAGMDFADVIREAVDSCVVLLALIGRQWATVADGEGRRRLDNPDDYVRFEIQTAFERGVRVIPVLVDGAKPPRQQQLPTELHKLARLNAFELSYGRYQYDAERLLDLIHRVLAAESTAGTMHQSAPTGDLEARISDVPLGINALPAGTQPIADESSTASTLDPGVAFIPEATAPDQAARLLADAERIAQSITSESQKARALANVASAVEATDADRAGRLFADAERIAQSLTDGRSKVWALTDIATALVATGVATYLDRVARLFADAERTAKAMNDGTSPTFARSYVVEALAAVDPDRAERAAQSWYEPVKSHALAEVAKALAATDPDRADRIAQSIHFEPSKMAAFIGIATALTATDPDAAAQMLADAERIAQSQLRDNKASGLADIAKALAATDPDRAARLFADAERIAQSIWPEDSKARTLAHVVTALAVIDPDRAERTARWSITDETQKAIALADIAKTVAATDPDRAERIARSIDNNFLKAIALADIAKALARAARAARNAPLSPSPTSPGEPSQPRTSRGRWRLLNRAARNAPPG